MNIKYFAILIVAVYLPLSGCAYKATEGGYNFEAQVFTKDGFPTLVAKCTPTESRADLEITGDLMPKIIKELFNLPTDEAQPAPSRPNIIEELAKVINKAVAPAHEAKVIELLNMQAVQADPLKDVLIIAIENGSLACPPSGRQELNRVKVPGIQRPIGAQSQ